MGSITKSVGWLERHLARMLVKRAAPQIILAGTLAFAGFSAAALNPMGVHQTQSPAVRASTLQIGGPHTFCYSDPDGDGHTICHILASQVSTVPNLGCSADPDGDGTFICYYKTDPTTPN
ncbi:MAG: hypothetical protein ACRDIE_19835 [Chloroflexota bacterium]